MKLTIRQQCRLLNISRSAYYYRPVPECNEFEIKVLKKILQIMKRLPFYGYRRVWRELKDKNVSETQVKLIMKKAGLLAIYPKRKLSKPNKYHKKYPYLLKNKDIWLPNQVWAADITYIRLQGSYVYLVAIMDLYSRRVLAWRVSNSLSTEFCLEALSEAICLYGIPAIFNTDQGSQFTSEAFIEALERKHIAISMDSVGRAADNIYIERLWRSVKYEEIYLQDYAGMRELENSLTRYFNFYNTERFHQSLEYQTPDEIYYGKFKQRSAA